MERRTVHFTGSQGDQLTGTLEFPADPRGAAIVAHCFTCSRVSPAASRIARGLASRGLAVLRFDFTGLGSSEGDFAGTTYSTNVADLVAAAEWLGREVSPVRLLVGHSLGGAAVLAAAAELAEVQAVATLNAPASPDHVAGLISGWEDAANRDDGVCDVDIGGRPFRLRRDFLDELRAVDQDERIRLLGRPLLVLHAPQDEIVGVDNAREIFDAARHPKSFVALDDADHLVTDPTQATYAAEVIAAWCTRYLAGGDVAAGEEDTDEQEGPEDGVAVTEEDPSALVQVVRHGRHRWLVDEPTDVGGTDRGPNPYDYLLGALGACTAMTMRMYARRKGWQFGASRVEVTHRRIHAQDCEECETTEGRVDHLHRVITLDPALGEEERTRLLEIADKCPVHRTLSSEIRITTSNG